MSAKMTEDALKALVDSEMRNSLGFYGGKLSEMRRKAEYYYLGLAKGDLSPPEVEGRSTVVSTDVRNTIESMLPQLMVKFVSGDSVVDFQPTKPGDEEKAQTCTDYLNHLFFKKNNGHNLTYTAFKDALLQKRGIVKVWWDTREEEKREEYKALDEVELAQLLDDDEIEPIEQAQYPDEEDQEAREDALKQIQEQMTQAQQAAQMGDPQAAQAVQAMQAQILQIQQTPPKMLTDLVVKRVARGGRLCIENVPPEEFIISRKTKQDLQQSPFVAHRVARTMSELKSMGYKNVDQLAGDDWAGAFNAERIERVSYDDEQAYLNAENSTLDESQRTAWVYECYIRCDWNGDGISELRKVVKCGNEILDNEEVDIIPFVSFCPIPLSHKFYGLSIADVAMESQRIKTNLMRGYLDGVALDINKRTFAVEGQVNLDDLLTSRPGGVVRIKAPGMVGPLDPTAGKGQYALEGLTFMEDFLENSTGWTRYSQGTDASALNKTATGMNIITNKADMRLDLIARHFAEGFAEMFKMMLKLVSQHQDREVEEHIAGDWLKIDPREWRNQFDLTINVGLGVGNKDQQAAHLSNLMSVQQNAFPLGVATPENIYNAAAELTKLAGFKSPDKFFTDPQKHPAPPQPNPEAAKAQAAMQSQQMQLQADQAKSAAEFQMREREQQMQSQIEMQRNQLEAARAQQDREHQAQIEHLKAQYQAQNDAQKMELERWKAELDANTKIVLKEMDAANAMKQTQIGLNKEGLQADESGNVAPSSAFLSAINENFAKLMQLHQQSTDQLAQLVTRPKTLVRGPDGRAIGVQ